MNLFFQAKNGIQNIVRSRWLGDMYIEQRKCSAYDLLRRDGRRDGHAGGDAAGQRQHVRQAGTGNGRAIRAEPERARARVRARESKRAPDSQSGEQKQRSLNGID